MINRRKRSRRVVRSFMTANPTCVSPRDTLSTAHDLMKQQHVRHLPVIDDGEPVGLVSERDLMAIERYRDVDPARVEVEEAMAALPYVVAPEAPLDDVVTGMADNRYGSALVVDDGKLVGVFTTVDALRATVKLCKTLARRRPAATPKRRAHAR